LLRRTTKNQSRHAPRHAPIVATRAIGTSEPVDSTIEAKTAAVISNYWGFSELRPLQHQAIAAAVGDGENAGQDWLLVMPTGGGKSLCYQAPAVIAGRTMIVVSPLIALMKDQVDGLKLRGIAAEAIHSGLAPGESGQIMRDLADGKLSLLFAAPERLLMPHMLAALGNLPANGPGSLCGIAIDEAHCISQWGHDFRPEYRRLAELREVLPHLPIFACTATATPRVREDIARQLALRDGLIMVGVFDRPNLTYRVQPRENPATQIVEAIKRHNNAAAIVYCLSRKDTDAMADALKAAGLDAKAYHAGMTPERRARVQDDFKSEKLDIVVATVAFGMGIDRPNVRCVIHATMPRSVEAYQQETGRAGRDGLPAECLLLYSAGDVMRWKQLMERSAQEMGTPKAALDVQMQLLEHMQRIAAGFTCRHKALSEYFGQPYQAPNCNACDVCLNESVAVDDSQTIARKILSCVARFANAGGPSGGQFGSVHLIDVLQGRNTEGVRSRGHDQLKTYGLLKGTEKSELQSFISQLIDAGCLERAGGQYPVLGLTPRGTIVLKGEQPVALMRARSIDRASAAKQAEQAAGTVAMSESETALFESLRALRRTLAEANKVPPYMIFGDDTLRELAMIRPASAATMHNAKGVGHVKVERFSNDFLPLIASESARFGLALDTLSPSTRSRPAPARPSASKARGTPSGPISPSKSLAFAMFRNNATMDEVIEKTGRKLATVSDYLAEFIELETPESIAAWVDDATHALIAPVVLDFAAQGSSQLRPIFEALGGTASTPDSQSAPGKATYDQIRTVMAHLKALGQLDVTPAATSFNPPNR